MIEMAGIKNIRTKSLGSNNKQNVVLATIEGLRNTKLRKMLQDFAENLLKRSWAKQTESVMI